MTTEKAAGSIDYRLVDGTHIFTSEHCEMVFSWVNRDRYGRLHAKVTVRTADGSAIMAIDQGLLTSGAFRDQLAQQAAKRNSNNAEPFTVLLFAAYDYLDREISYADAGQAPDFKPLEEFIDAVQPPGPQVVYGLFERGGLYSVASRPKVGKSIMLLNLALSVAKGDDWMGYGVEQGKVCLFQLEDSERTLKSRFEKMNVGPWPKDLYIHVTPFKLDSSNFQLAVDACSDSALVICDPIIQAAGVADWNSQSEVRDAYEHWRRLARDTNATVITSTHHRKMAGDFGDQMAGSIQALATVDGVLELFRDPNLGMTERRLTYTGRDWPEKADMVLGLDLDRLVWQPVGTMEDARQVAKENRVDTDEATVIEALPTTAPGLSQEDLVKSTGIPRNRVSQALVGLKDYIGSEGSGGRGNPVRYFRQS